MFQSVLTRHDRKYATNSTLKSGRRLFQRNLCLLELLNRGFKGVLTNLSTENYQLNFDFLFLSTFLCLFFNTHSIVKSSNIRSF